MKTASFSLCHHTGKVKAHKYFPTCLKQHSAGFFTEKRMLNGTKQNPLASSVTDSLYVQTMQWFTLLMHRKKTLAVYAPHGCDSLNDAT
jgi:hypothetical protein